MLQITLKQLFCPGLKKERVAKDLLDVFSTVGFPAKHLSGKGSQFTPDLKKEVCILI